MEECSEYRRAGLYVPTLSDWHLKSPKIWWPVLFVPLQVWYTKLKGIWQIPCKCLTYMLTRFVAITEFVGVLRESNYTYGVFGVVDMAPSSGVFPSSPEECISSCKFPAHAAACLCLAVSSGWKMPLLLCWWSVLMQGSNSLKSAKAISCVQSGRGGLLATEKAESNAFSRRPVTTWRTSRPAARRQKEPGTIGGWGGSMVSDSGSFCCKLCCWDQVAAPSRHPQGGRIATQLRLSLLVPRITNVAAGSNALEAVVL